MGGNKYDQPAGFFVTFEGIDGTGKTTQLEVLASAFLANNRVVVRAKEPGDLVNGTYVGSELGKHIRHILFFSEVNTATGILDEEARDILFLADHIQLWRKTIVPALREGKVVLCDRYADSQFAYAAGKNGSSWVNQMYEERFGPVPDATVLLTGDPAVLISRTKRAGTVDEGKQEGKSWASIESQRIINDAYLQRLAGQPRTIIVEVTPDKGIQTVANEIWTAVWAKYQTRDRLVKHGG